MYTYNFKNHVDLLNQNIDYKSSRSKELNFYNVTLINHVEFLYGFEMFFILLDFLNGNDDTETCVYSIYNLHSRIVDTYDNLISAIKSGTITTFYPDQKSGKIEGILDELFFNASIFIDGDEEFNDAEKLQEILNETEESIFE